MADTHNVTAWHIRNGKFPGSPCTLDELQEMPTAALQMEGETRGYKNTHLGRGKLIQLIHEMDVKYRADNQVTEKHTPRAQLSTTPKPSPDPDQQECSPARRRGKDTFSINDLHQRSLPELRRMGEKRGQLNLKMQRFTLIHWLPPHAGD
jgi:hypothetical protein